MIAYVLLGAGLVLVMEGLALALAPSRMEQVLEAFTRMEPQIRRLLGLLAVTAGVALVWLARWLGV